MEYFAIYIYMQHIIRGSTKKVMSYKMQIYNPGYVVNV